MAARAPPEAAWFDVDGVPAEGAERAFDLELGHFRLLFKNDLMPCCLQFGHSWSFHLPRS